MTATRFYRLRRPEPPWGDYGDMLFHGMASRVQAGDLELERTGPFVPPISQPGRFVVVTAEFLDRLRESGLNGIESGPVQKKRIPLLDWREWEPFGTKEMKHPAGNEPENYILRRKHSPEAAQQLGELYELRFRKGIQISRDGGYHLVASSWDGSDFVVAMDEHPIYNYVSERARDWLMQNATEWVAFEIEKVEQARQPPGYMDSLAHFERAMPLPLTDFRWSELHSAYNGTEDVVAQLTEAYAQRGLSSERLGDLINEVQHQGDTSTAMYAVATHLIELARHASPADALMLLTHAGVIYANSDGPDAVPCPTFLREDFAASASDGAKMLSSLLPLATDFDAYKWAVAGLAGFIGHHSFARFLDGLDLYEGQFHHALLDEPFPKEE